MKRLFVGLTLPQTHVQHLQTLQNGIPDARWVAPRNMHITLRFIGEVDEDVVEEIASALDHVSVDPFELSLQDLGTFGRPAHALWVGVKDQPSGALLNLHKIIDHAAVRTGQKPEGRKYTPHVTLAWLSKQAPAQAHLDKHLAYHTDIALDSFKVIGFTLFESVLTHRNAEYNPLYKYDF